MTHTYCDLPPSRGPASTDALLLHGLEHHIPGLLWMSRDLAHLAVASSGCQDM